MTRSHRPADPLARMRSKVLLTKVPLVTGLLLATGCAEPPAEPAAKPPIETRRTVGKTTQNVLDLAAALAEGGVVADPSASREGLDVVTGAHRAVAAQTSIMTAEHALKLHEAEHGSRPKTHAAFMQQIIRPGDPDGLRLPMLPYYQEYAFDPKSGGLVVVEFPARKAQRERETTGAAGL